MVARPWMVLIALAALSSLGAQSRTTNFIVDAPDQRFAERVGQWAEYYRKEKALQWLGVEMPNWPRPIPLRVTVSNKGSGGATSFVFDNGRILSIQMEIEGSMDRLIASVLPHEVTHTVLAYRFKQPVPRWADEGGSVLSEDDQERVRHDQLVRQILNTPGRAIPLRRLFALKEYPRDVMVLYAEGFSVTSFLVGKSNRRAFLDFVGDGMRSGWDQAVSRHYGFSNVEALEQAWIAQLRDTKRQGEATLAKADVPAPAARPTLSARAVVRQTLPPATPVMLGTPRGVFRGVQEVEEEQQRPAPEPVRQPQVAPRMPPATLLPPRPVTRQPGWDDRP